MLSKALSTALFSAICATVGPYKNVFPSKRAFWSEFKQLSIKAKTLHACRVPPKTRVERTKTSTLSAYYSGSSCPFSIPPNPPFTSYLKHKFRSKEPFPSTVAKTSRIPSRKDLRGAAMSLQWQDPFCSSPILNADWLNPFVKASFRDSYPFSGVLKGVLSFLRFS